LARDLKTATQEDLVELGKKLGTEPLLLSVLSSVFQTLAEEVPLFFDGSLDEVAAPLTGSAYKLFLEDVGPHKIEVIHILHKKTRMNERDAVDFVNKVPCCVLAHVGWEEASLLADALVRAGAQAHVSSM
jgi:ribosomal protein L7/L12